MKLAPITALLAISITPSVANAAALKCEFKQKQQCVADAACWKVKPTLTAIVDTDAKRYTRCDESGCDAFDATFSGDGAKYLTIELPGRGAFAKVGPTGDILEVVSLGSAALVSHGSCK